MMDKVLPNEVKQEFPILERTQNCKEFTFSSWKINYMNTSQVEDCGSQFNNELKIKNVFF